ncbi:MAG: DUF4276 family protein [Nitrospirota bacterium]
MNKHLHVIAEGHSEVAFVNGKLKQHLNNHNIKTTPHCFGCAGQHGGFAKRKGFENAKQDIFKFIKETFPDKENCFTTMYDLYALPDDFPELDKAKHIHDVYEKVDFLEEKFATAINDTRFIPHIQLHELETIIFADPKVLLVHYKEDIHKKAIDKLINIVEEKDGNPELINDGIETCPTSRITNEINRFGKRKRAVWDVISENINIDIVRKKCKHFNEWLTILESLGR